MWPQTNTKDLWIVFNIAQFVQDICKELDMHPLELLSQEFKKCYLGCLLRQCKCVNKAVEHLLTAKGSIQV